MSEIEILDSPLGRCSLKRTNRKTLGISILPDGSIQLVAPLEAKESEIAKKVLKRKLWINRQRRMFAQINVMKPKLKYVSGATHRYLGKQYHLKVLKASENSVKLIVGRFLVQTKDKSEAAVEALLDAWMRFHAEEQFSRRIENWKPWCNRRKLPKPKLHLRNMAKRWGSSHKNGKIFLNPQLIRTPSICIDYVIAHEICHLKYPYHDRAFYRVLSEVFSNWKAVKLRLEQAEF